MMGGGRSPGFPRSTRATAASTILTREHTATVLTATDLPATDLTATDLPATDLPETAVLLLAMLR